MSSLKSNVDRCIIRCALLKSNLEISQVVITPVCSYHCCMFAVDEDSSEQHFILSVMLYIFLYIFFCSFQTSLSLLAEPKRV